MRAFFGDRGRRLLVGVGVLALFAALFVIIGQNRTITRQGAAIVALSQQNLNSQTNHHAATVKKDTQLQQALDAANAALAEVKASAEVIEYEGGVIAYQNGAIINAQQQGHALLMAVTAIEAQLSQAETGVGGALIKGQAQINTYLHYLTCVGTNPTNTAVCGAAPPLPAT